MLTLVCGGLLCFVGFFAARNIISYIDGLGQQAAIDSGVIVEAEIVGDIPTSSKGSSKRLLKYEYTDENGVRYTGYWNRVDSDEVSAYIGHKIEIYIDGEGSSIPVGDDPDLSTSLAWSIVFSVVVGVGFIVTVVVYCKIFGGIAKAWKKQRLEAENPSNTDNNEKIEDEQHEKTDQPEKTEQPRQTVSDNKGDITVKFTLTFGSLDATKIKNPRIRDIEKAVLFLKETPETFMVLEPRVPIDEFTFIQAMGFEDGKCHAEAQRRDGKVLRIFGTDDMTEQELLTILKDFLGGKVPDISGWKHIDDF
ncbi:MAG: hypothetical protein HDT28_02495 [Clostridiales bacterium]|nr:hypothetical protein [Clostridiales bacterium]